HKYNELEKQRKDFICQYSTLEEEKKDIVEYLKRSLLEREDEATNLSERLENLQRTSERDRDDLLLQHSQLSRELQDRNDRLASENRTLAAQLADLEEFQEQKEQLMSDLESLEKQLANQKEEHKVTIHSLEMNALMEKERLKREMQSHMEAMVAEVQHLAYQKIPEKARLALEENKEVRARFNRLLDQTRVLLAENKVLRDRETHLRVDMDVLEDQLREFSHKSCIRKKVVEQLTEKSQRLQAELKACRQEHEDILAEMKSLRLEESRENRGEGGGPEMKLEEERRRRSQLESIIQEAAIALRQALREASAEQKLQENSDIQWKQLMHDLLVILDRSLPLRTGSASTNTTTKEQMPEPTSPRAETLNPPSSLHPQLQRRPGGAAPPPHSRKPSNQKIDAAFRASTCRNSTSKTK
ncbi:hypothetical protein LDENG_00157520, partial [Lucifuga dentata]